MTMTVSPPTPLLRWPGRSAHPRRGCGVAGERHRRSLWWPNRTPVPRVYPTANTSWHGRRFDGSVEGESATAQLPLGFRAAAARFRTGTAPTSTRAATSHARGQRVSQAGAQRAQGHKA